MSDELPKEEVNIVSIEEQAATDALCPDVPQKPFNGQFVEGNKGGPGSPFRSNSLRLKASLQKKLTPEVMERIIDKIIASADKGEQWALQEIMNRAFGKPKESFEIEGGSASQAIMFNFVRSKAQEDLQPTTVEVKEIKDKE